jgi:sulfur carrier protein
MTAAVSAVVNGERRELRPGTTLSDVVASLTGAPSGVAVAVDGDVVPRSAWSSTVVRDGVRVEVLTAVQGG